MNPNTELLKPRVRSHERKLIREALARHGSRTVAAKALGITTETLRQKLAQK